MSKQLVIDLKTKLRTHFSYKYILTIDER